MKAKTVNFCKVLAFAGALLPFAAKADDTQPENWGMHMVGAASPVKAQMIWFHDSLLLPITVSIAVFVLGLLIWVALRYNAKANPVPSKTTHNTMLEVVWTLIPVIILVVIIVPSMKLLYLADRAVNAEMTLKATGYQWYWGYEYPDNGGINFLANLVKEEDLKEGQRRLLSTDNPVVVPVDTVIRVQTAATDVLHAFAVPALGFKIDANPGQLNEAWFKATQTGTFYGQCSELCGAGHGFMPIEIKVVTKEEFAEWVKAQGGHMPGEAPVAAETKAADPSADPKADERTHTKPAGEK